MTKPYRRSMKNILINPSFQLRYMFWLSGTALILIFIYGALTYYYIGENYSLLIDLAPMTDEAKAQLYKELREIILKISAISLCFIAVVSWIGLLFSHRTAGPLYHFE